MSSEPDRTGRGVDVEPLAAGDARLAHATRHDGGVRRHATVRGEDTLRLDQAVDVVRCRLPADEDHRLAALAALLGSVGVEHDLPGRRPRRGVEAACGDVELRVRVEPRVQELVELARVDPCDRLLAVDQALGGHVDRGADRGRRRALRRARLQEVERPLLDGELDVLHVAVVPLELLHRLDQLLVRLRQPLLHLLEGLRRPDAGDDVLALRVDEVLAVHALLAGRRVAREADAGRRLLAPVPEHHLDDVDGRADVVGDRVRSPVDLRARVVPRLEHAQNGPTQLLACVLRKRSLGLLLEDVLERLDELREVVGRQVDVLLDATLALEVCERLLEAVPVDALHDLAVHLDEAPVGVLCEAAVPRRAAEPLDCRVGEAEVEDRVHHPGHRDRSSRPDGDEQRVLRVAEALARPLLEPADVLLDLLVEARHVAAARHEGPARVGRDREAGRHRNAKLGHLRQPDALASE